MGSHISIVYLHSWANGGLFRKSFSAPMSCTVPPIFSFSSFSISCFTLSFLIHLELIFVWGERQGSNFIFLHVDVYFKNAIISPVYTFDIFVRYQISLVNSWLFLLFWSTSLQMCFNTSTTMFLLPHSKTYLEMRNGHFSSIVILLRIPFDVQGLLLLLLFHKNLDYFSYFC